MARYCGICGEPKEIHTKMGRWGGRLCPVETVLPGTKHKPTVSRPRRLVPIANRRKRRLSLTEIKQLLQQERDSR